MRWIWSSDAWATVEWPNFKLKLTLCKFRQLPLYSTLSRVAAAVKQSRRPQRIVGPKMPVHLLSTNSRWQGYQGWLGIQEQSQSRGAANFLCKLNVCEWRACVLFALRRLGEKHRPQSNSERFPRCFSRGFWVELCFNEFFTRNAEHSQCLLN